MNKKRLISCVLMLFIGAVVYIASSNEPLNIVISNDAPVKSIGIQNLTTNEPSDELLVDEPLQITNRFLSVNENNQQTIIQTGLEFVNSRNDLHNTLESAKEIRSLIDSLVLNIRLGGEINENLVMSVISLDDAYLKELVQELKNKLANENDFLINERLLLANIYSKDAMIRRDALSNDLILQAEKLREEVLSYAPDNWKANFDSGLSLSLYEENSGNLSKAVQYFEEAKNIQYNLGDGNDSYLFTYLNLSAIYLKQKDFGNAISVLYEGLEMYPNNEIINNEIINIYSIENEK